MAKPTATPFLEMATAVNITAADATFFIATTAGQPPYRYVVPAGGTIDLAPGYCRPRPTSNPAVFLPSIIHMRTQGRVVAIDSDEGKAFLAGQAPRPPAKPESGRPAR